jgi:hypothetical protein
MQQQDYRRIGGTRFTVEDVVAADRGITIVHAHHAFSFSLCGGGMCRGTELSKTPSEAGAARYNGAQSAAG